MSVGPVLQRLLEAEKTAEGVRMEVHEGLGIWEAFPLPRHVKAAQRIQNSLRTSPGHDCGCFAMQDVYVRFPDGSLKRPDISIWCKEPVEEDEAVAEVPGAIIEIVSEDSKRKDLEFNPPLYLSQGVRDYVVYDPFTGAVSHFRCGMDVRDDQAPFTLSLALGCVVDFPAAAPATPRKGTGNESGI